MSLRGLAEITGEVDDPTSIICGWQRSSVVRMSVIGRRTFPPCARSRVVGKLSAMGQPTRPTQPSIHPGWSVNEYSNPCISRAFYDL